MRKPAVWVVGSSNIDFIMQVPHLPSAGETVTDGAFRQVFGGKGANQAVAAARAGGRVTFVTCLGNDPYAVAMKRNFAADGIDLSRVVDDANQASGTALIMVDREGRNCIAVAPGANDALLPAHVEALAAAVPRDSVVVLQMEIPAATNRRVLELAARHGWRVVFNYAPTRGGSVPLSAAVAVLVVNENEAAELLGWPAVSGAQAAEAAAALQRLGPETVVITLGADGLLARTGAGAPIRQAAFRVKPVDTTAAGDTFCGALAVALAEAQPPAQALRFASAAAALSVTVMGAQPSIPTRDRIEAFLALQVSKGG
jgi:ribokinase